MLFGIIRQAVTHRNSIRQCNKTNRKVSLVSLHYFV